MATKTVTALVCFLWLGSVARADDLAWVNKSPTLAALPPNGQIYIDARSTGTVGANNQAVYQLRKVGTQQWFEAPAGLNQGVYGAFIAPPSGPGMYEIRPVVKNAQGTTIFTGATKQIAVP